MARPIDSPEALRALTRADFTLSDQQWAAVAAPLEPAVVIAGAGSGKTSLMAARVVHLVANGLVGPDQVLGLTFTTKAAAELRNRVRASLADAGLGPGRPAEVVDGVAAEQLEPTVTTYNAYAAELLTDHGLRIGHEPDTRVLADASRYQLAARAIAAHREPVELLSDSPQYVIDALLALESALSEHLVDPDELRAHDTELRPQVLAALEKGPKKELPALLDAIDKRAELIALVEDYRRLKAELGLMDFSDQIALAARLAEEQPGVGALERDRFRVVLLDEYQDTSVAQARMLRALFSGPSVSTGPTNSTGPITGGRGHAVTAVGDPNQAIYGWRGASVSNIVHFGEDFPAADGSAEVPAYPLTVNRRSDRHILDTANAIAAPLLEASSSVHPLEAKPEAEAGSVDTVVHETYDAELGWLADEVRATHDSLVAEDTARPVDEQRHQLWREIGVLTRDNAHAADVFDALTRAEVPVEIVGLTGLLRLPEVSDVVATLALIADLTANAELLQLLNGPRWAIGPRDLALLGRRSRELARAPGPVRGDDMALDEQLAVAVAGADPTEVAALSDALADPGDLPYSPEARVRFGLLAEELRMLRGHADEPLLELVRRIIDACGIDVELASSVGEAARARRDNLDLFVKAVAEFSALDGEVTLPALLAWLQAEDDMGTGLDIATPSEADSVKLLTVHRAKGLEWDVVFVVGACTEKFPHEKLRSQWTRSPQVLPIPLRGDARDLPVLREISGKGLAEFTDAAREHQAEEELRLAYVAFTRPRKALTVSSYCWKSGRKSPLGPSAYQDTVRDAMAGWGAEPSAWLDTPEEGTVNPILEVSDAPSWPARTSTEESMRRLDAAERFAAVDPDAPDDLDLVAGSRVAQWDAEIERLLAEARTVRTGTVEVPRPASLSATALARLRDDPGQFARDVARPMPRQPSPAARFGTRFHAWVEARFGQQGLLDPEDLPGRADAGIEDDAELQALIASFESGPFADRRPHAVEAPFSLVLAGQLVRGRIDAVYEDGPGYLVVDWKTNRAHTADPMQLAVYRLAWAELMGVPLESVRAAFHYVRDGETVEPTDLPDRAGLEGSLSS